MPTNGASSVGVPVQLRLTRPKAGSIRSAPHNLIWLEILYESLKFFGELHVPHFKVTNFGHLASSCADSGILLLISGASCRSEAENWE